MQKVLLLVGGLFALLLVAVLIGGTLLFFSSEFSSGDATFLAEAASEEAEMKLASDAPADEALARGVAASPRVATAPAAAANAKVAVAAAPAPATEAASAADLKIIRNGSLTIVVPDPAAALTAIEQIIAELPGAFIATAEMRRAGDAQPTALTLRVPAAAFDRALASLRALAEEVLAEQTTARDVTEEYTDLDARLRNLRAAETQLLALVERADTVEDLLQIEKRLAEVRGEIEQLQGRPKRAAGPHCAGNYPGVAARPGRPLGGDCQRSSARGARRDRVHPHVPQ